MNTVANSSENEIVLSGLSGGNLLAFLAALGTFRTLSLAMPAERIRMSWRPLGGAWRPVLCFRAAISAQLVLETVVGVFKPFQQSPDTHPAMLWRHWLSETVGRPDGFRRAIVEADTGPVTGPPAWLVGIGTDARLGGQEDSDSAFRASRSDYLLGNLRNIVSTTTEGHLEKALFKPWEYDDPMDNLSLKFDASEDRRYALQWSAPSGDPDRKKRGNMLGANRLAIEAIPLFPTVVDGMRLATTGFTGKRSAREFTWGLWDAPVSLDTVRSLLALADLQRQVPDHGRLRALGVAAVYRCRRETVGKTRIFTPACAVVSSAV